MYEEINLKNIKNKYKIIPKKHLGQNFIFDQNILNKIISNILPIKNFNIIENSHQFILLASLDLFLKTSI